MIASQCTPSPSEALQLPSFLHARWQAGPTRTHAHASPASMGWLRYVCSRKIRFHKMREEQSPDQKECAIRVGVSYLRSGGYLQNISLPDSQPASSQPRTGSTEGAGSFHHHIHHHIVNAVHCTRSHTTPQKIANAIPTNASLNNQFAQLPRHRSCVGVTGPSPPGLGLETEVDCVASGELRIGRRGAGMTVVPVPAGDGLNSLARGGCEVRCS